MQIEITETHKRMLKRLQIEWRSDSFGSIGEMGIDSKRPYGNSDVLHDIAEMAEIAETDENDDVCYTKRGIAKMRQLHQDMATILKQLIADACE